MCVRVGVMVRKKKIDRERERDGKKDWVLFNEKNLQLRDLVGCCQAVRVLKLVSPKQENRATFEAEFHFHPKVFFLHQFSVKVLPVRETAPTPVGHAEKKIEVTSFTRRRRRWKLLPRCSHHTWSLPDFLKVFSSKPRKF